MTTLSPTPRKLHITEMIESLPMFCPQDNPAKLSVCELCEKAFIQPIDGTDLACSTCDKKDDDSYFDQALEDNAAYDHEISNQLR